MKILIVSDNSTTMSKSDQQKYDVALLPLVLTSTDHKSYIDGVFDLTNEEIMTSIKKGINFFSSCTPVGYMQNFIEEKLKIYDKLIFLPISKGWSSQYNHLKKIEENYKDRIKVIDTCSFGFVLEFLAVLLRNKINEGVYDLNELEYIANFFNKRTLGFFAVKNIEGILASGRIPKIIGKILKFAKLYPIIKIDEVNKKDGVVKKWSNVYKHILDSAYEEFGTLIDNIEDITILISNNSDEEIATFKQIIQEFTRFDIDKINVRVCPNIFYPIVLDEAIGLQIVFKNLRFKK